MRFVEAKPHLELLRDEVLRILATGLQERHISEVSVEARVKDTASFVKKILRKGYEDPWNDIRDKVGARLTAVHAEAVPQLESMVRELFDVSHYENKRLSLEPNKLDYLGSHFEASLLRPPAGSEDAEITFELQIHSAAEGLWAGMSHDLLYKAPDEPPVEVKRSLYRLLALVELFDVEVSRAKKAIIDQPGYPEALVLSELERHFLTLTARRHDPKLSRYIIEELRPLWSDQELVDYPQRLESFVSANSPKLTMIYEDYLDDDRNPLVSQPESLLVFERLENDFQRLPSVWSEHLPTVLLTSLSEIWGKPIVSSDEWGSGQVG